MSAETDYITYLETKVYDQDYQIKDLEAMLMLMMFAEANKVNKDLIYVKASLLLWKSRPYSHETIKAYKTLLNDCQA